MDAQRLLLIVFDRAPSVAVPGTGGEVLARTGGPWLHRVVEAQSTQVIARRDTRIRSTKLSLETADRPERPN